MPSVEAAADVLDGARRRWPDASHHAWAWRLRDGQHRAHDAGEPGGSAGRPILARIDGKELADVVVVVARWFGGTKLGVGGLIRAYGGCAGRTLDRARIVEVVPTVELRITHAYDDTGPVQAVIGSLGLDVVGTRWEQEVVTTVRTRQVDCDAVIDALLTRTSGRVKVDTT